MKVTAEVGANKRKYASPWDDKGRDHPSKDILISVETHPTEPESFVLLQIEGVYYSVLADSLKRAIINAGNV